MAELAEFRATLKEAARQMDFEDVDVNEAGVAFLVFDETFMGLSFDAKTNHLSIYTYVKEVPEEAPLEVYKMLLDAQVFHRLTRGATLSLDDRTHVVLAHLDLRFDPLDAEVLLSLIQNLLHVTLEMKNRIEELLEAKPASEVPVLMPPELMNALAV